MSEEDAKKALNEQYGGEDATMPGAGMNAFKFTKYSNAYMLVYVRKSDWDQACSTSTAFSCRTPLVYTRLIKAADFCLCFLWIWTLLCRAGLEAVTSVSVYRA